jgi:type II secretory pathway pseudopilin PulG
MLHPPRITARRPAAMTLLEVVISIALIAMLLGALLTFFFQTTEIREQASLTASRTQLVQGFFDQLERELHASVAADQYGFPGLNQIAGDRRNLTFVTTPLPPDHTFNLYQGNEWELAPAPRHDLRQVTYGLFIDPDDETDEGDPLVMGILRTERRALDPVETEEDVADGEDLLYVRHDLIAPELGYLEFRYFDGVEWSTTWTVSQGNRLPHLIQVTVGFVSLVREELEDTDLDEFPVSEYPLGPDKISVNRFSKLIRVPAADEMYSAHLYRLGDETEEIYETGGAADETGDEEGL